MSGRLSISRTEAKVERVRQVMCGGYRLTVWMIASQPDMKNENVSKIITEDLECRKSAQKWCQDRWMMIRRCAACRWVRTSLSIFKLRQTYFVLVLLAYQPSWPNAKSIRLEGQWWWYYFTHSWEDKGVHYLSQEYLSESNSATEVRTHILRFRSPSSLTITPRRHPRLAS